VCPPCPTYNPPPTTTTDAPADTTRRPNLNRIKNWTKKDFQNWINNKQFDKNIRKNFDDFNGALLVQLYKLSESSPEFVITALLKMNDSVSLSDALYFWAELDKLFN
jgi:hypothetical protein